MTPTDLQTTGHLSALFDADGAIFTVNLANHPITTIEARNAPPVLAFLARNTLGTFAPDGAYTFVPRQDVTFSRAANPGYKPLYLRCLRRWVRLALTHWLKKNAMMTNPSQPTPLRTCVRASLLALALVLTAVLSS